MLKEERELRRVLLQRMNGDYFDFGVYERITSLRRAIYEDAAKVAGQEDGYVTKNDGFNRVCEDCGETIAAAIRERGKK